VNSSANPARDYLKDKPTVSAGSKPIASYNAGMRGPTTNPSAASYLDKENPISASLNKNKPTISASSKPTTTKPSGYNI